MEERGRAESGAVAVPFQVRIGYAAVMLTPAALCLVFLATPRTQESAQAAPAAHWIWSAMEVQEQQAAYFLRDFAVSADCVQATLRGSCDDKLEVYLNGELLVVNDQWTEALEMDVLSRLEPGATNRLSIRGWNDGGPGGLWIALELEASDGTRRSILSDKSWWAKAEVPEGWNEPGFGTAGWAPASEIAALGQEPWGLPTSSTDGLPERPLEPEEIELPEGFRAELVYNVPRMSQGSWVSLTPGPAGTLFASDQYGSLYSITPSAIGAGEQGTRVTALELGVGEAQGLLWAFDSLYVVGGTSDSKRAGLYRLRDTDGDGELDESRLLRALVGNGEHGPHAVVLAPDGKALYVIAGNHTRLPELEHSLVPQTWGEDQLLPRLSDPGGHAVGKMAPGGWVCRTDPEGREWTLVACGMRNAYDLAFNDAGELFSFDSDMEWDVGLPWYRPTRVLHLVPGADFGWRTGSGKWPADSPDSWPAVVDVGLGSPTGVLFAPDAWPRPFGGSLLVADWAYGQVFATDLQAQGSTYTGELHSFLKGKPLPVTDLARLEDALYLTIGGRRSQSALYRITHVTQGANAQATAAASNPGLLARRAMEALGDERPSLEPIWNALASNDGFVRRAARVALERTPLADWRRRLAAEANPSVAQQGWIARAHALDPQATSAMKRAWAEEGYGWLLGLDWMALDPDTRLGALRAYALICIRLAPPLEPTRKQLNAKFEPHYPSLEPRLDRELTRTLVSLGADFAVPRSLELLASAGDQETRIFYFHTLRTARTGWDEELRKRYLGSLQYAIRDFQGGESLTKYLKIIREDFALGLGDADRIALSPYFINLEPPAKAPAKLRRFVRRWSLADLRQPLASDPKPNLERGLELLDEASCLSCHRFGGQGGSSGPDLSGAGNRFGRADLLRTLLDPSAQVSDQYQDTEVLTKDDRFFVGREEGTEDGVLLLRSLPPEEVLHRIERSNILMQNPHPLSRMPEGLLDAFERQEILDLLAALRNGPGS